MSRGSPSGERSRTSCATEAVSSPSHETPDCCDECHEHELPPAHEHEAPSPDSKPVCPLGCPNQWCSPGFVPLVMPLVPVTAVPAPERVCLRSDRLIDDGVPFCIERPPRPAR